MEKSSAFPATFITLAIDDMIPQNCCLKYVFKGY